MPLEKEIIIIGDIEMGCGNLTDDFISDKALSELIKELSKRKHPVDLIFNGDTFDFLKCPYFDKNRLTYPRHVTEKISLSKLNLIYHAHSKVFEALENFINNKKHQIYFIFGNHDFDLVYYDYLPYYYLDYSYNVISENQLELELAKALTVNIEPCVNFSSFPYIVETNLNELEAKDLTVTFNNDDGMVHHNFN